MPEVQTYGQLFRAKALLGACALGLASVLSASQEGAGDVVFLRDGTTETGEITAQSFHDLTFTPEKGSRKTVPWSSVQSITYGDAPDELASGLAKLGAGNLEEALKDLKAVPALEDLRPFVSQDALFLEAHLQQRLGHTAEARDAYTKLLKEAPRGRYVLAAGESLIALDLEAGAPDKAQAALDEIKAGLKDEAGTEAVVGLLEAGLLAASGKQADALARYGAVEGTAGADQGLLEEARLGRARMLVATNKSSEAEPLLRALVKDSQSARAQSGAWNTLGELQTAAGFAKKNADQIREGLYAYLRTVVQYKPLPGESTSEYERALAGTAKCFQYLSQLEQNAEKKKLHRDRQRDQVEQLQREYPNSPYLRQ